MDDRVYGEAAQNFRQQGRREFGRRGVLFLYVEVGGRLRTKLEEIFSSRFRGRGWRLAGP